MLFEVGIQIVYRSDFAPEKSLGFPALWMNSPSRHGAHWCEKASGSSGIYMYLLFFCWRNSWEVKTPTWWTSFLMIPLITLFRVLCWIILLEIYNLTKHSQNSPKLHSGKKNSLRRNICIRSKKTYWIHSGRNYSLHEDLGIYMYNWFLMFSKLSLLVEQQKIQIWMGCCANPPKFIQNTGIGRWRCTNTWTRPWVPAEDGKPRTGLSPWFWTNATVLQVGRKGTPKETHTSMFVWTTWIHVEAILFYRSPMAAAAKAGGLKFHVGMPCKTSMEQKCTGFEQPLTHWPIEDSIPYHEVSTYIYIYIYR